ncbi:MAG: PKD domain-containing protein, partial [Dehalococcoidia bacterium]|nr:PKD domain-containing protein [Dehalococcoidia bacterium]
MRRRIIILLALSLLLLLLTISTQAPDSRQLTVVINEVCWAGAASDHTLEWIELFNTTDAPIDLEGWLLVSSDGAPFIRLQGILAPHTNDDPTSGYFLLERGSDNSVPAIAADFIYQGALTNVGEVLTLSDAGGRIIDTANIVLSEESGRAWPAGSDDRGNPPFASMERVQFQAADAPENRASCILEISEDKTQLLFGTPKGENSVYNVLPIAQIRITPPIPHPGLPAEFSAAGSNDPNDPIESYEWQFGDGTTATGAIVSHTYPEAGQYLLTLLLTDSKGGKTRVMINVDVALTTPPIADFSLVLNPGQVVARAAELLTFQDESSDADSAIVSWEWNFGDGSEATGRYAAHTYATYGDYVVGLRVTDTQGEVGIQTRSVSIASQLPVVVLSFSPELPNEGQPVLFDASESFDPDGVIVSYQWDFNGDGLLDAQGPEQSASYTFQSGGRFTPQVTVLDDQSEAMSREITIEVNAAPIAQFQVSSFEPNELEHVSFADLSHDSDGTIVERTWDFGDETRSAQPSPNHVYQQSGTMVVTLTVTDEGGAIGTAVASLDVGNLPPIAALTVANSSLTTG